MNEEQYTGFLYQSIVEIPKTFHQVDWTFVEYHDKPFVEGEQAFYKLIKDHEDEFINNPFLYLHFLRSVASCLVMLAVQKKQPISKCLEYLRRRLDLEYCRSDIYGKAAQLVVLADYAVECGKIELAHMLLKEEQKQLNETAQFCQSWLKTISERLDRMTGQYEGSDKAD